MSRRSFLRRFGIGAGAVAVVAGAGLSWRAIDQAVFSPGTGTAYDPWRADLDGPAPMSLVAAAILAASAHNTQPWAFAVRPDRIDLYADRSRTMGTMDPLGRELQLSLGCALENLVLAASAHGLAARVAPLPDESRPDLVAVVELEPSTRTAPALYRAIPERHTNRAAYEEDRGVAKTSLDAMSGLADEPDVALAWLTRPDDRVRFGMAIIDATAALIADAEQARDDFAWYRQDWREIQDRRDGVTMDAAGLGEPTRTLVRLLPASSQADMQQGWLEATRDRHVATAAAYGLVLVRRRRDPRQLLRAGRLYQRAHLHATADGLAMQPLNQLLERADREAVTTIGTTFTSVVADLAPSGWEMVTAFRIGHPTSSGALSPRRAVEDVVRLPGS
jgi:hypothetical protein